MTRSGENGDKVGFSAPTWIGLILIAVAIGGPSLSAYLGGENRITTLEATTKEHERRLLDGEKRDIDLRNEILLEIRELRKLVTK